MKRLAIAALALVAVAAPAVTVTAWGNTGHRLIGVAAMRALPDDCLLYTSDGADE